MKPRRDQRRQTLHTAPPLFHPPPGRTLSARPYSTSSLNRSLWRLVGHERIGGGRAPPGIGARQSPHTYFLYAPCTLRRAETSRFQPKREARDPWTIQLPRAIS